MVVDVPDSGDDFNPDPVLDGGFNVGDTNTNNLLDPGETWEYQSTTTATEEGEFCNVATVTANPEDSMEEVTDSDPACYLVDDDPPPPPPPPAGDGCTPGFWKNNADKKEAVAWPEMPEADRTIEPGDALSSVGFAGFTVLNGDATTFLDALNAQGGDEYALMRHAAAAVLNAAHPNVDYPLTVEEVVDAVNMALAGGDIEGTKDQLAGYNELGCSIDQKGDPIPEVEEEEVEAVDQVFATYSETELVTTSSFSGEDDESSGWSGELEDDLAAPVVEEPEKENLLGEDPEDADEEGDGSGDGDLEGDLTLELDPIDRDQETSSWKTSPRGGRGKAG